MKKNNLNWAFKTFILSIFLSIFFSVFSQSLFPKLTFVFSIFIIVFFIIVSVFFDMINVAVTSIDIKQLEKFSEQRGYKTAVKLCENTEKVSSFCGDVVGDICSILSGAGGVSLVVNMHIQDADIYFIMTCLVSSIIAGLTIFGKAIMKNYAVERCDAVMMKTGALLDASFSKKIKNKTKK